MTDVAGILGAISLGDFYADLWRLLLSFGALFAILGFWNWVVSRLGSF